MATVTTPELTIEQTGQVHDEPLFEVIGGKVVEMRPMGTYPVEVASIIHEYLAPFVRQARLGRSIIEALFRINNQTQYCPDLAFISDERWPIELRSPKRRPWKVIPDLAVEVISKDDTAWEVMTKVRTYFEAGSRAVWLIFPNLEIVHVYESYTQVRILTRSDVLDGGNVIPSFQLPLETLFCGEAPADDEDDD
jgi:Uma2 family endonuclease